MVRWRPLVALFALGACGEQPSLVGDAAHARKTDAAIPDAALHDAGPDADPYCHYDCFGHSDCADGTITTWSHGPVPCDQWTGDCPHHVAWTCAQGCLIDPSSTYEGLPFAQVLCAETPAAHAGDACPGLTNCLPTPATLSGDGSITNTYLTCDFASGTCVDATPPVIADYLDACAGGNAQAGASGYAYDPTCQSSVCLLHHDPIQGCTASGCSAPCNGDQECPPGSVCDDTLAKLDTMDVPHAVCRPGWRGTPLPLDCL